MHNSLNIKNAKRSIQTIRDCTHIIATHDFHTKTLQVRMLYNEAVAMQDSQFIVTFADDVENAGASVKPLAEAVVMNGCVRFTVSPSKQYPELENNIPMYSEVIISSIASFVRQSVTPSNPSQVIGNSKWLQH